MGEPTNINRSWLTADGEVINPNAPAGGGGAGRFRSSVGPLGAVESFDSTLPPPDAPAARYAVTPDPMKAGGGVAAVNPPPETKPRTIVVKKLQDARNDIDVQIEILADAVDSSMSDAGDTKADFTGIHVELPSYDTLNGKVSKETTKFVMKGTVPIQIRYQLEANRTALSGYGRGTTTADLAAGDVTIGFHESCHVKDYLAWFKTKSLPVFKGAVKTTEAAYTQKFSDFNDAFLKFFSDLEAHTLKVTDEVGNPTKSQWQASKKP